MGGKKVDEWVVRKGANLVVQKGGSASKWVDELVDEMDTLSGASRAVYWAEMRAVGMVHNWVEL